jgi:hypothetical protein
LISLRSRTISSFVIMFIWTYRKTCHFKSLVSYNIRLSGPPKKIILIEHMMIKTIYITNKNLKTLLSALSTKCLCVPVIESLKNWKKLYILDLEQLMGRNNSSFFVLIFVVPWHKISPYAIPPPLFPDKRLLCHYDKILKCRH